jgi:hypothetical protein
MSEMKRFKMRSKIVRVITLLFVSALVTFMTGQTLYAQDASTFREYPGANLSGLVTAQIKMPEERCRKLCTERSGCAGFDFSSSNGQCRIFGGIASAKDDSSSIAATRYPVPGFRPDAVQPTNETPVANNPEVEEEPTENVRKNFKYYPNNDLFGFDLDQAAATSMNQCEGLCSENSECRAFTFNEWNQKCFLKSGAGDLRLEPRARTGVLVEDQQPSYREAQIVMEYYRGYTITGSQIGGSRASSSRDDCESQCWGNDECIAFSFIRGAKQCRIYDHATNRFTKAGVDSGAKIQPRP